MEADTREPHFEDLDPSPQRRLPGDGLGESIDEQHARIVERIADLRACRAAINDELRVLVAREAIVASMRRLAAKMATAGEGDDEPPGD